MKKLFIGTVFILFVSVALKAQDVQTETKQEIKVEVSHNCSGEMVKETHKDCNHSAAQKETCQNHVKAQGNENCSGQGQSEKKEEKECKSSSNQKSKEEQTGKSTKKSKKSNSKKEELRMGEKC